VRDSHPAGVSLQATLCCCGDDGGIICAPLQVVLGTRTLPGCLGTQHPAAEETMVASIAHH
jgi:hypothetical protein